MNIIITCGSDFTNYEAAKEFIYYLYDKGDINYPFTIITDKVTELHTIIAKEFSVPIKLHKNYIDIADKLIAFWDGEYKETKHMIDTMEGKDIFICYYENT